MVEGAKTSTEEMHSHWVKKYNKVSYLDPCVPHSPSQSCISFFSLSGMINTLKLLLVKISRALLASAPPEEKALWPLRGEGLWAYAQPRNALKEQADALSMRGLKRE